MGFYDEADTVEAYIKMAEGYDGRELIARLEKWLPTGASILELGMGPGTDLTLLNQRYTATGSDVSQLFIDRYAAAHEGADLLLLDAVTLSTDRQFDAIYSNKVLHHLTPDELDRSIERQAALLTADGLILHSFWRGDGSETHCGEVTHNYQIEELRLRLGAWFTVREADHYEEFAPADSIVILAQKCQR